MAGDIAQTSHPTASRVNLDRHSRYVEPVPKSRPRHAANGGSDLRRNLACPGRP